MVAGDAGDEGVGGRRVRRAMHARAGGLGGRLELVQQLLESIQRVVLDAACLLAELLEVGQLRDGRGATAADRLSGAAQVGTQLCVGERFARRGREVVRVAAAHSGAPAARMSARCTALTLAPMRLSPPPMLSRHDESTAVTTSAPVATMLAHLSVEHRQRDVGVLDREGAAEAAALGGLRQLEQFEPAHTGEQPLGRVADPRHALRVARGMQRDAPRERRAHVLHAEAADEELGELEEPAAERLGVTREPVLPGLARHSRQQLADPADA